MEIIPAGQPGTQIEMTRRTYLERRWPDAPMFQDIATRWCAGHSCRLLALVWQAYDLLAANDFDKVAFEAEDEAREESLNYLLAVRIDQCKEKAPFCVVHQPPEQTKRKRGRGRSPQPDIGFVLYANPRAVWPMEGKVLMHDQDVSAYVAEIDTNFVKARYAAFSREGAILGYLMAGDAEAALSRVGDALGCTLRNHPHFCQRPHKLSDHTRTNLPHPNSPADFVCHHLILCLSLARDSACSATS